MTVRKSGIRTAIFVQYANPGSYPPVLNAVHLLAERGWKVILIGTRVRGQEGLEVPRHPGWSVELAQPGRSGLALKAHYLRFFLHSVRQVLKAPAGTWVHVSDPLAAPVGLVALLSRRGVVYHEHDSPDGAASPALRLCLRARRIVVARANILVAPNRDRLRRLADGTGRVRPSITAWNCPRRIEVPPVRLVAAAGLRLLYHGSVTPDRVPLTVIEALTLVPADVTLTIVGYATSGSPDYPNAIAERARALGLRERVVVRAPISRQRLLAFAAGHDVGLAIVTVDGTNSNMATMPGASNKVFDYLAAGLPLIVADRPDWRSAYVDTGLAQACDPQDHTSVAAVIEWLRVNPERRRAMGAAGRERVLAQWNYDEQFAPVIDLMERPPASKPMGHGGERARMARS